MNKFLENLGEIFILVVTISVFILCIGIIVAIIVVIWKLMLAVGG